MAYKLSTNLNLISEENLLKLCDKFQVPLVVLNYYNFGNEPPPQDNSWFDVMKAAMLNDNHQNDWNFIYNTYGQNPRNLYNRLQFLHQEVNLEVQIENDVPENDKNLNDFQAILQQYQYLGFGNVLLDPQVETNARQVYEKLRRVTDSLIRMNNKWKHSKRYEKKWEWPACPKIQRCCVERLFDRAVTLRQYLKMLKEFVKNDVNGVSKIEVLVIETERLISKIANDAFLSETNPPRFVQQGKTFALKYRHSLGGKFYPLQSQGSTSTARVSIINANQFSSIKGDADHYRKTIGSKSTGTLQDFEVEIGAVNVDQRTGHLTIEFPECQIVQGRTILTRDETHDTIKNEKFCFIVEFVARITEDLAITVWTISQPVIVGAAKCYKLRSLATVLWDNALCEFDRSTIVVEQRMPCWKLIDALDHLHIRYLGIPLVNINKAYLRDRVLRRTEGPSRPEDDITFQLFCDDPIFEEFTFWEWYMGALKLGKRFFLDMCRNGCIVGYLGRPRVHPLLIDCAALTILLHFSESMVGGLVISWKDENGGVHSAGPLDREIFQNRSLPNAIEDTARTGNFRFIYPNLDLEILYGRYPRPSPALIVRGGYVRVDNRLELAFDLPNNNGNGIGGNNP